ncbi:hypothetical protein OROHE_025535 [Orobanche hederae]
MGSSVYAPNIVPSFLFFTVCSFFIFHCLYVVYMGSSDNVSLDDILSQNHQILTTLHRGSVEQAKASHVYSYKHGFKGFAAKLSEEQAARVAEILGVVSVFPNTKRGLHTTHYWDFIMGLVGKDNMEEIAGYSTKNQVNVIFGFIDTVC